MNFLDNTFDTQEIDLTQCFNDMHTIHKILVRVSSDFVVQIFNVSTFIDIF